MVDALKNAGGNVKFTIYPEAGHDSWTETYNNPELYEWFLKQKQKGTSYFDCYNMALLDRYKKQLVAIFSFDVIYKKNGFTLVAEMV